MYVNDWGVWRAYYKHTIYILTRCSFIMCGPT